MDQDDDIHDAPAGAPPRFLAWMRSAAFSAAGWESTDLGIQTEPKRAAGGWLWVGLCFRSPMPNLAEAGLDGVMVVRSSKACARAQAGNNGRACCLL